ncbi:hypothetical protein JHK82_055788 [Glycine max]|nr:hypothetical protein JHK82_055788 [Glycine max]
MQEEENEVSSFGFGEEMARNNAKLCLMLFISSLDKLEYPFDGHVGQAKRCHIWSKITIQSHKKAIALSTTHENLYVTTTEQSDFIQVLRLVYKYHFDDARVYFTKEKDAFIQVEAFAKVMDDTSVQGVIIDLSNTSIMDKTSKESNVTIANEVLHHIHELASKQPTTLNEATSREKG